MRRTLPPLSALRAFDSVGRHDSLSHAGRELNVTHAAMSQQMRKLEEWLGTSLFNRENRRMILTEAGSVYHKSVRRAFDALEHATQSVSRSDDQRPLMVTTTPSFASRWLVPRLGKFQNKYPDVPIYIAPGNNVVDFKTASIDIGIRFGAGNWPDLSVERLLNADLIPVCTQSYLDRNSPLDRPSDIQHHFLLHDGDESEWLHWLGVNGVPDLQLDRGIVYSDAVFAYQAAIEGQGLYLAELGLVRDDIGTGRLIAALDGRKGITGFYHIVSPVGRPLRTNAQIFKNWLIEEAARNVGSQDLAGPSKTAM